MTNLSLKRVTRTLAYYQPGWPPTNLGGFVTWAAEELAAIPEPYRESAEIELTGNDDGLEIEISYSRPFLPAELDAAEARRVAAAERQRIHDRAVFERLKEMFGDEEETQIGGIPFAQGSAPMPKGCICPPMDFAALGHMTNCPCREER